MEKKKNVVMKREDLSSRKVPIGKEEKKGYETS